MSSPRIFLIAGLSLLLVAFLLRGLGADAVWFFVFLSAGVVLKAVFLFLTFRRKGFRLSPGLWLILIGVALLGVSLVFKSVQSDSLARQILLYVAIAFKASGCLLLIARR